MLTLTRSVGERIIIGDDIVIEIRAILDSHQVRIAIDAPRQVPVHRAELLEAISRENRDAVTTDGGDRLLGAIGGRPSGPSDQPGATGAAGGHDGPAGPVKPAEPSDPPAPPEGAG